MMWKSTQIGQHQHRSGLPYDAADGNPFAVLQGTDTDYKEVDWSAQSEHLHKSGKHIWGGFPSHIIPSHTQASGPRHGSQQMGVYGSRQMPLYESKRTTVCKSKQMASTSANANCAPSSNTCKTNHEKTPDHYLQLMDALKEGSDKSYPVSNHKGNVSLNARKYNRWQNNLHENNGKFNSSYQSLPVKNGRSNSVGRLRSYGDRSKSVTKVYRPVSKQFSESSGHLSELGLFENGNGNAFQQIKSVNDDGKRVDQNRKFNGKTTSFQKAVDIKVSEPFFSRRKPHLIEIGKAEVAVISVSCKNKSSLNSIRLLNAKPRESFNMCFTLSAEKTVTDQASSAHPVYPSIISGPFHLFPGTSFCFHLSCTAAIVGYHRATLLFDFGEQKIVRYVNLIAGDEVTKALAPSKPYVKPIPCVCTVDAYRIVTGRPPPLPPFAKPLDQYLVPLEVVKSLKKHHTLPVFSIELSFENYQNYFSSLIYAEEMQWKEDISMYDMPDCTMHLDKFGYLVLKVPGLLEGRPSVIYRDKIIVRPHGSKVQYQGFVYKVRAEEVSLMFHASFHENFIANQRYEVRFTYSRITIRRAHHAIQASKCLTKNFLFPLSIPTATIDHHVDTFLPLNRALNVEQRQAVLEILRKVGGPPYLIYGPPGTGKTVTVVESILQILKNKVDSKILACAPSNAAADVLLDRLKGYVQVMDMLRLNAYTRPIDDVPSEILRYCCTGDGLAFTCPSLEKLLKYKVVVSTYWSVALLEAQDVARGHFTHIFLDEAGQGMEPEALVAVAHAAGPSAVVVLAGDYQQLGPIIRSPIAQKFGLEKSLLQRLSSMPLYSRIGKRDGVSEFDKKAVTKLLRNYRSHPAILQLPSTLFYDGDLKACAPDEICCSFCGWEELPDKDFPVLFIGIEGKEEREGKSPSWFNPQEASKVIAVVKKLKECRRNRLTDNDIGIISPYSQQVNKIKTALAMKHMQGIKTGSVEQFQGQEKRVIIISTVRSSKENSAHAHQIGFLGNPKRFNVAITRAKALLVVIGNPYVLSQDKYWGQFLQYCLKHKSYAGCPIPRENSNMLNDEDDVPSNSDANVSAAYEKMWPDHTR